MEKKKEYKNLKPFKKGHDPRRNMKGRPKLPDLKETIAKILAEEIIDGMTALEAILIAQRNKAIKKADTRAAQELIDRGFGKAKQDVDVTSDKPIVLKVILPDGGNDKSDT